MHLDISSKAVYNSFATVLKKMSPDITDENVNKLRDCYSKSTLCMLDYFILYTNYFNVATLPTVPGFIEYINMIVEEPQVDEIKDVNTHLKRLMTKLKVLQLSKNVIKDIEVKIREVCGTGTLTVNKEICLNKNFKVVVYPHSSVTRLVEFCLIDLGIVLKGYLICEKQNKPDENWYFKYMH